MILYADVKTQSIQKFLAVTDYRRQRQIAYNQEHHITPRSVSRAVEESLSSYRQTTEQAHALLNETGGNIDLTETVRELEQEMLGAANNLEFEKAALLRDQIRELKRTLDPGKPGVEAGARGSRSVSYSKTRRGARPKVAPSTDLQSQRD